jgi:hypothetical protein
MASREPKEKLSNRAHLGGAPLQQVRAGGGADEARTPDDQEAPSLDPRGAAGASLDGAHPPARFRWWWSPKDMFPPVLEAATCETPRRAW